MNRLQQIQNEVAKEIGYISYLAYLTELSQNAEFYFEERLIKLNNEVSKRYAKECCVANFKAINKEFSEAKIILL